MENSLKIESTNESEARFVKQGDRFDTDVSNKKVRLDNNVKKVKEIVTVLAKMGNMRGVRKPTAVEVEMMVESGAKLVDVCKEFASNDVFCKDEFGLVVQELWNSKLSIVEKLEVTKRKMEKSRVTSQGSTSKLLITQPTVNPINVNQHHTNIIQTPSTVDTHTKVTKIVQKLLHPNVLDPTPSRDYMNTTLTCQTCKDTINETDNTLVCDACEKGYHLKCLQLNPTSIPNGASQEWHCAKCLATSNGKPLQLKYGRVIRNISTTKLSSN